MSGWGTGSRTAPAVAWHPPTVPVLISGPRPPIRVLAVLSSAWSAVLSGRRDAASTPAPDRGVLAAQSAPLEVVFVGPASRVRVGPVRGLVPVRSSTLSDLAAARRTRSSGRRLGARTTPGWWARKGARRWSFCRSPRPSSCAADPCTCAPLRSDAVGLGSRTPIAWIRRVRRRAPSRSRGLELHSPGSHGRVPVDAVPRGVIVAS